MAAPVTIEEVSKGHQPATTFLALWNLYCHAVDDLVDETTDVECRLLTHRKALQIYSTPFFATYCQQLEPVINAAIHAYADSVLLEGCADIVDKSMWDHLRQAPLNVVVAVAEICGGWQHARSVSLRIRRDGWARTHHPDGTPH